MLKVYRPSVVVGINQSMTSSRGSMRLIESRFATWPDRLHNHEYTCNEYSFSGQWMLTAWFSTLSPLALYTEHQWMNHMQCRVSRSNGLGYLYIGRSERAEGKLNPTCMCHSRHDVVPTLHIQLYWFRDDTYMVSIDESLNASRRRLMLTCANALAMHVSLMSRRNKYKLPDEYQGIGMKKGSFHPRYRIVCTLIWQVWPCNNIKWMLCA